MSAEGEARIHEVFCPYVERIISTQTIVKGLTSSNGVEKRLGKVERRIDVLTAILILGLAFDKTWPFISRVLFP